MKNNLKYIFVLTAILFLSQIVKSQERGSPKDVPKGFMLIEGDIIVPDNYYDKAAWLKNSNWPKVGNVYTIPYDFDANVNATNQQRSINAMLEWEAVANVNFVVRNGEANYIRFRDSDGNSSMVGMMSGGQYVNMYNWDMKYKICHELCHALGFWHEQSRPDRDIYVTINWNCIDVSPDNYSNNFNKEVDAGYYGPYDFMSVMHYPGWAFYDPNDNAACNKNGMTIIVKTPNEAYQDSIGQREYLSYWDIRMMSFKYPYSNWRFAWGGFSGTESGTFDEPFNTFTEGYNSTPAGGKLWLRGGAMDAQDDVTFDKAMTIEPTWGDVEIY